MKVFLLSTSFIFICLVSAAQPTIEWAESLGGSLDDWAYAIEETSDNGYIVAGYSESNDGDLNSNNGGSDAWVIKLNNLGGIVWETSLGGSLNDLLEDIHQTSDGGYITAGYSHSSDGDVSSNAGGSDLWVVKLSSLGVIEWENTYGGSADDLASEIKQTADGGYMVIGISGSTDGDVSGNLGANDYWIVKLDITGVVQWEKSLGGSLGDEAYSFQQSSDGGYIITGYSSSNDGDVTASNGLGDYWTVKIDSIGNIQWETSLGGSAEDWAESVQQTNDGGYILAGYAESTDGDVSGNLGLSTYWIAKLSSIGTLEWEKSLGGAANDWAFSIQQTNDGGYSVAGVSESVDGDVSSNIGGNDFWLAKINDVGNMEWEKSLGGTSIDWAFSHQQTSDGGWIIAGFSSSADVDVSSNNGGNDVWIVKLASFIGIDELQNNLISIYPNPSTSMVNVNIDESYKGMKYFITDVTGKKIEQGRLHEISNSIDVSHLEPGIYSFHIQQKQFSIKILKQ
ncbi:MAG: T9SS type A sorting domain-containing protein [Crocinitomicaceae bacterium]|nr:T9SS type A sorting domain-containing protein [Crocinitomicaceae bacterium]